ncbi:substrate-binding periplasmic protein [Andreprevotia chitinilytica]|uniref:substrate-binding periplasmic protein n=1 Tax=Andreprevotia chitinilytica TaxID=396808 RepID=UPI00068A271A|nr:ABC transporter substrate-binding protein [Andreprevotia chitinilytica]
MAIMLALLLVAPCSWAAGEPVLRVAIGETKPPYVWEEEKRGVEYDLVSTILRTAGYQPEVLHAPNKRAQSWLISKQVDAVIGNEGGFVSEPYIAYKNMAITLCSSKLELHSIPDLQRYNVVAFQNAQRYLGTDFALMAASNRGYSEASPQISLDRLLYSHRTDVAISDINIFQYFSTHLNAQLDGSQPLCPFALFPPTLYRLVFREEAARDRFNQALAQTLRSGLYESLAQRYALPAPNGKPYFKPPLP